MSSPVQIPFKSLIQIQRESSTAVYLQIAYQLINAVQRGVLINGIKLPGTRDLASQLEVHRKTIVAAYDELHAQGWVEIAPNKGTFIVSKTAEAIEHRDATTADFLAQYPKKAGFEFSKSILLDNPIEQSSCELLFTDGLPDVRLAPIGQLSQRYSANLKRKTNRKYLGYFTQERSNQFKFMLSNYLNNSRGLHIAPQNIMITRGIEMGIYIAATTLIAPGDRVVVGELSYFATNMIFQKAGAKISSVPIDKQGISVEAVRQLCEKHPIRMLYLTPHHHYPTTVTLSAQRRIELLQLSAQYGFIILEDDYDYDFHYSSSPVLPLASADSLGMVVYVGSFCKSLAPGFRTGFLIAPENLITEMNKFLGILDRQGDILMEQVLAELLEDGEIHRHLKKATKIYHERRDHFCQLLQSELSTYVDFDKPQGGLAVWTKWDLRLNLMRISKICEKKNLHLPQTLLYQTKNLSAMRLGFGNLDLEEQSKAIAILKEAIEEVL